MNWSVGITTAPRKTPTLTRCVESIRDAGWSDLYFHDDLSLIGIWPSWWIAINTLWLRSPHAAAYMVVQDDALFAKETRTRLESELWPSTDTGLVSIYTPEMHEGPRRWNRCTMTNPFGAVALIIPRDAIIELLTSRICIEWRLFGPDHGARNVETVLALWCKSVERSYWYVYPSMVQHIGESSTYESGNAAIGFKAAPSFSLTGPPSAD